MTHALSTMSNETDEDFFDRAARLHPGFWQPSKATQYKQAKEKWERAESRRVKDLREQITCGLAIGIVLTLTAAVTVFFGDQPVPVNVQVQTPPQAPALKVPAIIVDTPKVAVVTVPTPKVVKKHLHPPGANELNLAAPIEWTDFAQVQDQCKAPYNLLSDEIVHAKHEGVPVHVLGLTASGWLRIEAKGVYSTEGECTHGRTCWIPPSCWTD